MNKTSIEASLKLAGDKFDTAYVTSILEKEPSYLRIKGQSFQAAKGNICIANYTAWGFHVEEAASTDMDTHLNPIFDFIEQNLEKLQLLSEELEAKWQIDVCITICHERTPGMVLTARQMGLANAVGAYISFDMYAQQYIFEDITFEKCPLCGL